jgi:hypothetical protein
VCVLGQSAFVCMFSGWRVYIIMIFGVGAPIYCGIGSIVPMQFFLFWIAYVILSQRAYMLINIQGARMIM